VTVQVAYSIIDRRPEKKMVAWCLKHNVKIFAYGDVFPYGTQLQLLEDGGRGT
jgi:diketogulonate reductase-like aldo/keto reductase